MSISLFEHNRAAHDAAFPVLAGVKSDDKVFCSNMTFDATINPVVYEGGVPFFIDTERDTWNMPKWAWLLISTVHRGGLKRLRPSAIVWRGHR